MTGVKKVQFSKPPLSHSTSFLCLGGNDVISGQVSDHHPIVHDGVFFWNVMMQGNIRGCGPNYNNGFGFIESDKAYTARLVKIALVIAEAIYRDPSIDVITLCEGPIQSEHVDVLLQTMKIFSFMSRFMTDEGFHKPTTIGQNWGLLMLADVSYTVTKVSTEGAEHHPKLANRFQLWKLAQAGFEKYIALAHFPFTCDEDKTEKMALSASGIAYCEWISTLMGHYNNDSLVFCADFNFNPHLIGQPNERVLDAIAPNNSILLTVDGAAHHKITRAVTVDGILLSSRAKQIHGTLNPNANLKSEYRFFQSHMKWAKKIILNLDNTVTQDGAPGHALQ